MTIFYILIAVAVCYFFIVFVGLRLVVPFMGFGKSWPQAELPVGIKMIIADLESQSADQTAYLRQAARIILDKTLYQWKHTRGKAAVRLPRLFVKDFAEIWDTDDFIYCTGINYALYILLVNSKFFSAKGGSQPKADQPLAGANNSGGKPENEYVRPRYSFVNFVIHQYLQVKVGDKWIDVDPAGNGIRGRPIGTHLSWFG